jgi:ribonucleoside-diphosphate reductase alpha chain
MRILKQRYFGDGEETWGDVVNRVIDNIIPEASEERKESTREMMLHGYFIPNSPCLVNAGKPNSGLAACFVVDFPDDIVGIYKTKLDFALIARKGGGCGTSLSKIRPEGANVARSTHGYAGGGVKFADTISHDADALTQSGFRSMAIMFTESVYHPDILKFITAKHEEGRMANANISVVVDDAFMSAVINDEKYWTEFNGVKYQEYRARDIFELIVEGMWRNGEPGVLFKTRIDDSPYKYSGQEIFGTNPCIVGDTFIQTVEGEIKIKDLVGKEIDVYCQIDENQLGISRAFNIRKTKKDAELVQIITSRGDLICTPDHLIYTKNRGYIEAKDITRSDNLCALNQKMISEMYKGISLTGTNEYIKEHRFIASHYWDINDKIVHHKDGNTLNNKLSNLEALEHSYHSSITNLGHDDWNEHDEFGRFIKKENKKVKKSVTLDYYPTGVNLKVLSVRYLPYKEDVYDMEVETYHNFFANNIVVHNCSEQPLPPNGVCNLGSIDLSKFYDKGCAKEINWFNLGYAVRWGVRFLDAVIDKTDFPTKEIEQWALENRAIGLGIMGYADLCLMKEIAYGSDEALELLHDILRFISIFAENESVKMGRELGVPKACENLPLPRRNVTLTTIAPTGTISLIAGCSSGIEPIFSEITIRNDKTGTYTFENNLADKPYFRCAVSTNGASEVTWEEHIKTLATAQTFIDSGVSKTINFPNHTHRETIGKAVILAWKMQCKGLAVYRDGSRDDQVLSPKQVKKDKCPVCGNDMIMVNGKLRCLVCTKDALMEKTVTYYD